MINITNETDIIDVEIIVTPYRNTDNETISNERYLNSELLNYIDNN